MDKKDKIKMKNKPIDMITSYCYECGGDLPDYRYVEQPKIIIKNGEKFILCPECYKKGQEQDFKDGARKILEKSKLKDVNVEKAVNLLWEFLIRENREINKEEFEFICELARAG